MGEKAKKLPGGGELVFLPWQLSLATLLEQLLMRLEEAGLSSRGHTLICLSGTPSLPCPLTPTTKPKMAHSLAKVAVQMKLRLLRMASSSEGQDAHPRSAQRCRGQCVGRGTPHAGPIDHLDTGGSSLSAQNPCFTWPLRLLTPAGLLLR